MTNANETESTAYEPPKVWKYDGDMNAPTGNLPTAGARVEQKLPVGKHPIQLYSLATPNGQKITIMLEELLEAGKDAEYDAYTINIMKGEQFGSDFVAINPNSKIPAMVIYNNKEQDAEPLRLFESGSMLLHLAEKYDMFLPPVGDPKRTETLNWLFWQMGSAPYLGGGFGHFYAYAPTKQKYPIDRFAMEAKRQLDVLEKHLAHNKYMVGDGDDDYTIADIAIYPWYGRLVLGHLYEGSATFLNVATDYPNVRRWAQRIEERPAVQRGQIVNKPWGDDGLTERHSAQDFEPSKL